MVFERHNGIVRPTRVDIDLERVRDNASTLHAASGDRLYAVVKADAYGHGAVEVCRALAGHPAVEGFAVSLVEEGVELRDAGIAGPVLVMGPRLADGATAVLEHDLTPVVSSEADLNCFAARGRERGQPVRVHAKIDTGMYRLGLPIDTAVAVLCGAVQRGGVEIEGLSTHLACADEDSPADSNSQTATQLARFRQVRRQLAEAGLTFDRVHAANSAAIMNFGRLAAFGYSRPGLALYGNGDGAEKLRQVMRWVTEVGVVRDVATGEGVSYGLAWRADRPSRVAVLPVGYADGYPRRLTNTAQVLIRGRRFPVVGKVCMDMTLVDVTDLGDSVVVGDEVTVLGDQGNDAIRTAEFAAWAGLTEYEVTCGVSKRVPRSYVASSVSGVEEGE